MRLAILGATSQISKDLVYSFFKNNDYHITLFARRPQAVNDWLTSIGLHSKYRVKHFDDFSKDLEFDAIINFVGVGNPAQVSVMGSSILDITYGYDSMALEYLERHPNCRYIFLSSGAAYGSSFKEPANESSYAVIPINNIQPQDWYGVAKLHAECRHRALPQFHIVDLRVFNYFSHTQDMSARFLITDIVRSIKLQTVLNTSADYMRRDFLNPVDFYQLVCKVLSAEPTNIAVDCFSLGSIDKSELLSAMKERFGLEYQVTNLKTGVNATGQKPFYYSENRRAEEFGYHPTLTSLEGISREVELYLKLGNGK